VITDTHSILNRQRNHFFLLLTYVWFSDVRQTEIRTAEPLVPESSTFGVDVAIGNKKCTILQVLIKSS
jgi:hypothetical protein